MKELNIFFDMNKSYCKCTIEIRFKRKLIYGKHDKKYVTYNIFFWLILKTKLK